MSSERKGIRRVSGGWLFLLLTLALYIALLPFHPAFVQASLARFLKLGTDLLPILGLVFLFLWLFNLLGNLQQKAARLTSRDSGLRGWLLAVGLGVLSHGPIYPWYPLLRELMRKGARPALVAAFLYARSIKLPWLPVMAHYFGTEYMVVLTSLMLLLSPLHGWLVERLPGVES
jgi:uncharacterized membrane protein YraQ (UPF0718 family)